MKVLLFGASGFLGNALKIVFDSNNIECYTTSRSNKNSNYKIDITNFDEFDTLPQNFFTTVVNCATVLPGGDYLDSDYLDKIYNTNILGSQNICKWIEKQTTITKIINCSTLVVAKKPWTTPLTEENANTYPDGKHVLYCSSKLTQELLFKTFADNKKISLTQIRFSTLYGKNMIWGGLLCNLIDQAKNNKTINITNGSAVSADFLYVDDAAKIIVAAIKNDIDGVLNGASGIETSILQLAEVINHNLKNAIQINNVENPNSTLDRSLISIAKLSQIIDVTKFITLDQGIKKMIL